MAEIPLQPRSSKVFCCMSSGSAYATTGIPSVTKRNEMVEFGARQFLDQFSPSNYPWLNPEVIKQQRVRRKKLCSGLQILAGGSAAARSIKKIRPVRRTSSPVKSLPSPGDVIYRNSLIELIQVQTHHGQGQKEPVLIVPSLDREVLHSRPFSRKNSMVRNTWSTRDTPSS